MPFLAQLFLSVALTVVSTLIQQHQAAQRAAQRNKKAGPSFRGQYTSGGTEPLKIVLGTYGVPGHLEYSNTYGNDGETPNAFLADVLSLSDYPITQVSALWVDSSPVTIQTASSDSNLGYIVPEYTVSGKNYLGHRILDGTQTTVSSYLTSKFGSDANYPWESGMIGEGIAQAIMTARIQEVLFTGFPAYMFQLQGAPVLDPRESDDLGGDGDQEWGNVSTYGFSDNPIVLIYNILRGIHDADGNHIWGGHATAYQMPYANWSAAMDRCDESVSKKGGGSEKRYRAGIEISVDERPADVIAHLLAACNGRITYHHGQYFVLVDVPESADGSFTDADLLVDHPINFSPFPNLDSVVNGASATFLAPERAWEEKETAPYYNSDLEEEDDNRRLIEALELRAVFSGTQAQRIAKAVVSESRRFRRHVVVLRHGYGVYRPLQVLAWTSDEFQYSSKLFLITTKTEDEFGNIILALQEIDPTDFDWDAETDETDIVFAPMTPVAPPPQVMTGDSVAPYTFVDANGSGRRPGIEIGFAAGLDDVRAVRVQIRLNGETGIVFDGEVPYDPTEVAPVSRAVTWAGCLPNTAYQVRLLYVPFSGRETTWGEWLAVTTPAVGIGTEDLDATLQEMQRYFGVSIRDLQEVADTIASLGADQDAANYSDKQFLLNRIEVRSDQNLAAFTEAITVAIGPGSAVADAIQAVETLYGDTETGVLFRMSSYASPGGGWSRLGFETRATMGDVWSTASIYLESKTDGSSRIVLRGDEVYFIDTSDNILQALDSSGAYFNNARIKDLDATNITASKLDAAEILQNGSTITQLIANNAITNIQASVAASPVNITGNSTDHTWVTVASVTITPNGGSVLVMGTANCYGRNASADTAGYLEVRLRRAGTEVAKQHNAYVLVVGMQPQEASNSLLYVDTSPGASSITYDIQVCHSTLSADPGHYLTAAAGSGITATNLKK